MSTILLFSILAMLAVIVLLMILIVDQVRGVHRAIVPELEEEPEELEPLQEEKKKEEEPAKALADEDGTDEAPLPLASEEQPDASYGNLVGKRLWDAMTGKPLPDIDEAKVAELKPRYHIILTKHIEMLFAEGVEDGKRGSARMAANKHKIQGLRGTVISWIPQQYADTIYRAGFDSASATDAAARQAIEASLSEAVDALSARTELKPAEPLATKLLALSAGPAEGAAEPLQLEMAPQPTPAGGTAQGKAKVAEKAEAVT